MRRLDRENLVAALRRAVLVQPFGQRELILRSQGRVRYIQLTAMAQGAVLAVVALAAGWVGWASYGYFDQQHVIAKKDRELVQNRMSYAELLNDIDKSRTRFADIARRLEANHADLAGLIDQNKSLRADLRKSGKRHAASQSGDGKSGQRQTTLNTNLDKLEESLKNVQSRNRGLINNLHDTEKKLFSALEERTAVELEKERLATRVEELEERLANLQKSQEGLLDRMAETTVNDIDRVQRMIAITGLDVDDLLERAGSGRYGQGGPFVPLGGGAAKDNADDSFGAGVAALGSQMDRWAGLQTVMRSIPLIAPTDHYYIASRFGKRRDPINGHMAMHNGLDLAGSSRAEIYATAPGKVVFVGWRGRFGKMVEIDHGLGLRTRYAHLSRTMVKKGQKVSYREPIGLMGSTGRSTGRHVHYEIMLDGKSLDPFQFLKAGHNVFKG